MAKAAGRRLPLRSGGLFGSDRLCRLDTANFARLPLVVGEELRGDATSASRGGSGKPTGVLEQTLGLLGHLAFLEVVDELRSALALGLTNRFENPPSW